MARLLIYDAYENKVYTYNSLNENDPMPYSTERTLTLGSSGENRGARCSGRPSPPWRHGT